jgi:hypothetical protein
VQLCRLHNVAREPAFAGGLAMDSGMGKMVIGAVVLIGAFVAMAWLGWFGPMTKQFSAIKQNSVNSRR